MSRVTFTPAVRTAHRLERNTDIIEWTFERGCPPCQAVFSGN